MTIRDQRGKLLHDDPDPPFQPLMTQKAIAERFRVTQSRVDQLEKRAMRKFVAACERRAKRAKMSLVEWLLCGE